MKRSIKNTAHEIRSILADASEARIHPDTIETPAPGTALKMRVMHSVHTALMRSGRLAGRNHRRKNVQWPVQGESITPLGYGAEKVAYRVCDDGGQGGTVVSVYHRASFGKDPLEVVKEKKSRYETYRKYFGDLVVPTQFAIVDNPWGKGSKPASIQPFIEDAQKFGELGRAKVRKRASEDQQFATDLENLTVGYRRMLDDGLCPDFATSNLLVSGSNIRLIDTGSIFSRTRAEQWAEIHPNYQIVEDVAASASINPKG